jgi:uncharacterized protein
MNYKLSYYIIFSDYVNNKKDSIIFCTRTAEGIVVSDNIRQALEQERFYDLPEQVFQSLIKAKAIVPEEEYELSTVINENKKAIGNNGELYEVIQPSAMCQLGCDYCGQHHAKHYIKEEMFDKIIDRIRYKASLKKYDSLFIGWFGGEPLMGLQQIRKLSARLKELAASLGLEYGAKIVTNGLSLKENIFRELATDLNIRQIEITLDGTAEFHDQRRHTKEKGATFDIIFGNLLKIVNMEDYHQLGCSISVRCNVDGRNYTSVSDLIQLIAKHSLQDKLAYFYPIGVYSWAGNDAHQKSITKEEYAQMEIDWMIEMLEVGLMPSLLPRRNKQVCLAVSPVSEMYDPYGNIFNCTEVSLTPFYEKTEYVLGNLRFTEASDISKSKPLVNWNDEVLEGKFPCHSCKMLPVCGGGCPKSWHEDMRACPTAKFNIKERLALSYVASKSDLKALADETLVGAETV